MKVQICVARQHGESDETIEGFVALSVVSVPELKDLRHWAGLDPASVMATAEFVSPEIRTSHNIGIGIASPEIHKIEPQNKPAAISAQTVALTYDHKEVTMKTQIRKQHIDASGVQQPTLRLSPSAQTRKQKAQL